MRAALQDKSGCCPRGRGACMRQKALTLTELIVVLVILALLSAIAIPVFVHRAEEAKIRTAQQEVREIASAEELCGLNHSVYLPIQVLDDIPNDTSNVALPQQPDEIRNDYDVYVIDTLRPLDEQLNGPVQLAQKQLDPGTALDTPKLRRIRELWQGPFLNPKRVYERPNDTGSVVKTRRDFPLDPWGEPYRLYSPLGIVGSAAENLTDFDSDSFSDGRLTTRDRRFDRFAVVSFGPDNQPGGIDESGNTTPIGDDIFYFFGTVMSETSYANMFF
jgi:prepilin-type N-terminal cleavage/methylation domain-containing protein